MAARGTRRPHPRRVYKKARTRKAGKSSGCAVVLFVVGLTLLIAAAGAGGGIILAVLGGAR